MAADVPDRHLAHLVASESNPSGGYSEYALQPLGVARPPHGKITVPVVCDVCGIPVECTVYSVDATRRLRWRWWLLAALCAVGAVVLAGAVGATFADHLPDRPATTPVAWFMVVGFMAVPGLAVLAFYRRRDARREDGLRVVARSGAHSLRPPGARFDSWYATEGGGE
ncbi:hypothetical protein Cme02nite_32450 [Catellatospora methionotrophica]|uniref:Uncharacterized protein n=1 Tax=Catellatospora methionotrophica TaxID=121620 RepID=A0A8J3PG09_9ACTN|nr:hypothetical protein [Catellatospora methionotrophica]GIG14913.1 hypothetical protein Cme02nite_32450 [Catellatospora methionotrophica]